MSERRSSVPQGSLRLSERRRTRRRRARIALVVLLILLGTGIVYALNQSAIRISKVTVYGADQSLADIAVRAMQGKYFGLIPRDSILFFPASRIRADILSTHPGIAALSIFRNGLTGISIKTNDRAPVARWCDVSSDCYFFDVGGFIYATTSADSASVAQAIQPINPFIVYAPLSDTERETSGTSPIGLTLPNAERLPSAFDFARQLDTFGSPVVRVVVRGDEVDDMLASGTRVTYVLGHEQDAFTALVSARGNFNLADGSLEYVDLRFDGKVYVKKK